MNTGLFDKARNWTKGTFGQIKAFMDDYDFASAPSFLLFMVVVTAGMTVNYFSLVGKGVKEIEAFAVSLLFEVGIAAWKFQGHRVKNSKAQADAVNIALWFSVVLAGFMLVASLTNKFDWGWIVASAAVAHVVFYLIFDSNDEIRKNRRENKAADNRIEQKNFTVDNAIREAEADLRIIHKITSSLERLRHDNSHLPIEELEFVLEATRTRLLAEYNASANVREATKGAADVNKDNKIGTRPIVSYASEAKDHISDFTKGQDVK